LNLRIIRDFLTSHIKIIDDLGMSSGNSDNGDENESFSSIMKGVKPLAQDKIDPDETPKPRPKLKSAENQKHLNRDLESKQVLGEIEFVTPALPDEVLSFVRGGIQEKLKNKLKKGLVPYEVKIDLHGATVKQAGKELQDSVEQACALGMRCILVIHGRGNSSQDNRPAIKTHVNQWLRELPEVLAFHTAQPKHGGTGALYVLLKRQREK